MSGVHNNTDLSVAKTLPENIILEKWIDSGFFWSGDVLVSELPRLAECVAGEQENRQPIMVTVRLSKNDDVAWLSYQVQGVIYAACQRCLEMMSINVSGEYRIAILKNESQVSAVEGAEYVLIDELDSNGHRKILPLKNMLEDELMLALPLSLKHDDCEALIQFADEAEEKLDNPFAALASLKGNLN